MKIAKLILMAVFILTTTLGFAQINPLNILVRDGRMWQSTCIQNGMGLMKQSWLQKMYYSYRLLLKSYFLKSSVKRTFFRTNRVKILLFGKFLF